LKAGELSPRPGEAVSVWRRYIELPRYLRTVSGKPDLIATLEQLSSSLGFERLAIASGTTFTLGLAESLASELSQAHGSPIAIAGNGVADVRSLASARQLAKADALVAVGGGKTIDVAKSACDVTDRPVIVVPTQLSADGIASPVSVLRTESGALESRRARLPIAVCVDLEVIGGASAERTRAGLGDLLANPGAVRDWRLAAAAGGE
jgi:glycerol-1-phosphate dehydrogenase [NAD(P)+]